ncbi:MAG: PDZ domain-containing protein [Alteraurantiacibacter sp. bin_em_oilr2.035]|nr:PDZ domain-containing protein [Alteraurantiacibacter sp. bin_em_oilr2.035]
MKFRTHAVAAALFCAAISTPAFADEIHAVTPSGATEAYFDLSLVDLSDTLANQCVDLGWTMVSSNETAVACELPVSFGNRLLSALVSPSYSTPPRQYLRFNMAGARGFSRVQVTGWQEIQTAFGQNQRTDMQSENYHNGAMGFLVGIDGLFPEGTTFPNHAFGDFTSQVVEDPRDGLLITQVNDGGAFHRAGIREGDILQRIAGERTKDGNDLSDGMHKAIREATYEVQFYRNGERMEVQVDREFRATIGPLPEPSFVASGASPAATTIVQQEAFSVAEELDRFADLLERGIISQEEFDIQKNRLLSSTP